MVGNSLHEETIFGFYDASYGNVFINRGNFQWETPEPSQTHFNAEGDKRAIVRLSLADGNTAFIISENGGALYCFTIENPPGQKAIRTEFDDWYIAYSINGKQTKRELYYGAGFLSASSRNVSLPAAADGVEITKFDGKKRLINF